MKDGVRCVAVLTRLLYGVQCMWYDWEKNCLFSIPIQGCICVGLPEDTPLLHRPTLRPRRILMSDPNWNNDRYYGNTFPRVGMQHARYIGVTFGRGFLNTARLRALLIYAQVFTVCYLLQGGGHHSYRSGPEWAHRFGHSRAHPNLPPDFCPDFLIET